jgi:2-amino-4-hydroxy-6-hydroxymethyldihydropteridine diphosphokinase
VNTVYLSLGSNLGDRMALIESALLEVDQLEATQVMRVSSLYDTDPVGVTDQPPFLNVVAHIETSLSPQQLLWNLKLIERRLGRIRSKRWGPRPIDIDILLYGSQQVEQPDLRIPHQALPERAFVLVPLLELAPDLEHPVSHERIAESLERLSDSDQQSVRRLGKLSY